MGHDGNIVGSTELVDERDFLLLMLIRRPRVIPKRWIEFHPVKALASLLVLPVLDHIGIEQLLDEVK
ncbi:hypothetical protein SDC9_158352 [bioreactor metagenome]|uniref:Uncharacterized protein n=1 Tax=bioreactor metagenome TaxID=1076179 RepID=A0A645F9S5_9ZZZZ